MILIGFHSEEALSRNSVKWTGKYLDDILNVTPREVFSSGSIRNGVAYYSPYALRERKGVELDITGIQLNKNSLVINYNRIGNDERDSGTIFRAVKKIISGMEAGVNNYPFCISVEEERIKSAAGEEALLKRINYYKSRNDWISLYNMFAPISELFKKEFIWNNAVILDNLSFAAAKLSEVYINLNQVYPDRQQREDFLKRQKQYREETIMLRERCIALNSGKASYYSNLGYSYYQFIRELTLRGGRRDGSVSECIRNCLLYINKALKIDPARIADHYRMGHVKMFAAKMEIGKQNRDADGFFGSRKMILEAIGSFRKAENFYELMPAVEDKDDARHKKEYVKSLYNIAAAYGELLYDDWDYMRYYIRFSDEGHKNDMEDKIRYSDKSLNYIEKCIMQDNNVVTERKILKEPIEIAGYDGAICGVFKLYAFGKYLFQRYWYLSRYGRVNNSESNDARSRAEIYFQKALKKRFPQELAKQGKGFIAEKLSRLYITKGEYSKAIETLKPFIRERTDYYLRYTFATALYKNGNSAEAADQLKTALEDKKANKTQWLGWFLISCIELSLDQNDKAYRSMGKAIDLANETGKRNLDSLYVSRAFISYRCGNIEEANRHLEAALKLNPGRESLKRRHKLWITAENNFDLCSTEQ